MSLIAAGHTLSAVVALACGALVLLLCKGTARHRFLGRIYVAAMVVLNVTQRGEAVKAADPLLQAPRPS